MVQYLEDVLRTTKVYNQNTYWMLGSLLSFRPRGVSRFGLMQELKAGNFYFKKSEQRERLIKLYFRMERGLPSYDWWPTQELKQLFAARSLTIYADKSRKTDMVEALEDSDEHVQFGRLMDLPPELRVRIYTMYYESLETLPYGPHQPPICLVSSQIRREALPLFYSTCRFKVGTVIPSCWDLPLQITTKRFLEHTPENLLARINKIELNVCLESPRWTGQTFIETWSIDVSRNNRTNGGAMIVHERPGQTGKEVQEVQRVHEMLVALVLQHPNALVATIVGALLKWKRG